MGVKVNNIKLRIQYSTLACKFNYRLTYITGQNYSWQ